MPKSFWTENSAASKVTWDKPILVVKDWDDGQVKPGDSNILAGAFCCSFASLASKDSKEDQFGKSKDCLAKSVQFWDGLRAGGKTEAQAFDAIRARIVQCLAPAEVKQEVIARLREQPNQNLEQQCAARLAENEQLKRELAAAVKQRPQQPKCSTKGGCAALQEELKKIKKDLQTAKKEARAAAKVKPYACPSCPLKDATIKSLQQRPNSELSPPPPKRSRLPHTTPSEHEESAEDKQIVSLKKMLEDKDKQIAYLQKLTDDNARRSTLVQMQGRFDQLGTDAFKALLGTD